MTPAVGNGVSYRCDAAVVSPQQLGRSESAFQTPSAISVGQDLVQRAQSYIPRHPWAGILPPRLPEASGLRRGRRYGPRIRRRGTRPRKYVLVLPSRWLLPWAAEWDSSRILTRRGINPRSAVAQMSQVSRSWRWP